MADTTQASTTEATGHSSKRKSRENTMEEKKKMKRLRRKRKIKDRKERESSLRKSLKEEQELGKRSEAEILKQKSIARCFWERWQWEVHKRREVISSHAHACTSRIHHASPYLREIDNSQLLESASGSNYEVGAYVGRGSFGVVKMSVYRGVNVAVKEFLPHTLLTDVKNEARILAMLSHPSMPLLLGISTATRPYKIVIQFHGLNSHGYSSCTIQKAIQNRIFDNGDIWISLSKQLFEAICYLHEEAHLIHNDLKSDNVLITNSFADILSFQIVIIDFGKATKISEGKKFELSNKQKEEYMQKCPHFAPEVIDGTANQSTASDIYGAGGILVSIYDYISLLPFYTDKPDICQAHLTISIKCRSVNAQLRPSAREAFESYKSQTKSYCA